MKKFFGSRPGMAVLFILASAACAISLAGIFYIIEILLKSPSASFIELCKGMFMLFSAWAIVSAVLLVATNIRDDWVIGFGAGFYYGTFLLSGFLDYFSWVIPFWAQLFLSAIIVGLVCYIVYLKLSSKDG